MISALHWGSTAEERARHYPCDDLLPRAERDLFRAITIDAPVPVVFRWLCQLRAAPYSYDWIDNLGRHSPRELTPGLEKLSPGQRFMTLFELLSFEQDRHITLAVVRRRHRSVFAGVAVTYWLDAAGEQRSRLVVKLGLRGYSRPAFWALAWGDLIMMRRQLLNLKSLSEGGAMPPARLPAK